MRFEGGRTAVVAAAIVAAAVAAPRGGVAQAYFVDAHLDQAFASEPLPSPVGFSLAAGRTSLVGPFGLHFGFRELLERGADGLAQSCGPSGCTDGPFDQSYTMRTVFVGLSYDFRNPVDVYMNLGLNVGRSYQVERLTHVDTGDRIEERTDSELSLGGSLDLRLRPLVGPLRPAFNVRYDRIFGAPCAADATCLPDRNVWSLSAGLSWVAPAG